ncbi:MAG: HAD-IA family hydrolase [Clostridia bacterium]|nr:HAD-IA family hydrolase [Clostridia bacterium]
MSYKLALFDMDGTVLDTLQDLADATNAVMVLHGYPTHSTEAVRGFVGNGALKLIENAVPTGTDSQKIQAVLADFKTYYGQHNAHATKPYAGVPEMLRALRAAGVRTAVVSNKPDFAVKALAKQYFPGLFDMAVGDREGVQKKPAPDSVFEAMRVLGYGADETVYIGDSDVDVETAKNAHVDGIFVDWGFRSVQTLRESGAKVIVSSPADITARILQ